MTRLAHQPGDYDLRGRDYETELCGQITDTIIDADRLASIEHKNGFPNFAIYRLVLAQDRQYLPAVRQWWVLFSIEWCRNQMRGGYDEDVAVNAAWDSLARVVAPNKALHPSRSAVAGMLGVDDESFRYLSGNLEKILLASIDLYWDWLQVSYRVTRLLERKC